MAAIFPSSLMKRSPSSESFEGSNLSVHRRAETTEMSSPLHINRAVKSHVHRVMKGVDERDPSVQKLSVAYFLCMVLVAIMSLCGQIVVQIWVSKSYQDARNVNDVGIQRMHDQRAAKSALALLYLPLPMADVQSSYLPQLKDSLEELKDGFNKVKYGNLNSNLQPKGRNALRLHLINLEKYYYPIIHSGSMIIANFSASNLASNFTRKNISPYVKTILENENNFFIEMDKIVEIYTSNAKYHLTILLIITWSISSAILITILLEGVCVIRPVISHLQTLMSERFDLLRAGLEAEASARSVSLIMVKYVGHEVKNPLLSTMNSIKSAGKVLQSITNSTLNHTHAHALIHKSALNKETHHFRSSGNRGSFSPITEHHSSENSAIPTGNHDGDRNTNREICDEKIQRKHDEEEGRGSDDRDRYAAPCDVAYGFDDGTCNWEDQVRGALGGPSNGRPGRGSPSLQRRGLGRDHPSHTGHVSQGYPSPSRCDPLPPLLHLRAQSEPDPGPSPCSHPHSDPHLGSDQNSIRQSPPSPCHEDFLSLHFSCSSALQMLKKAQENCRLINTVVEDVEDVCMLERGHIKLKIGKIRIKPMVSHVIEVMRDRKSGVDLIYLPIDDIELSNFVSDEHRVKQVLFNIVSNSLKFTQEGNVTIKVSSPNHSQIRFEIIDSGNGLLEEKCAKLLQPFSIVNNNQNIDNEINEKNGGKASAIGQPFSSYSNNGKFYDNSISARHSVSDSRYESINFINNDDCVDGGTGLGLYISRLLAELLGGHLSVTSVIGKGSNFCFQMPLNPTKNKSYQSSLHEFSPSSFSSSSSASSMPSSTSPPSSGNGSSPSFCPVLSSTPSSFSSSSLPSMMHSLSSTSIFNPSSCSLSNSHLYNLNSSHNNLPLTSHIPQALPIHIPTYSHKSNSHMPPPPPIHMPTSLHKSSSLASDPTCFSCCTSDPMHPTSIQQSPPIKSGMSVARSTSFPSSSSCGVTRVTADVTPTNVLPMCVDASDPQNSRLDDDVDNLRQEVMQGDEIKSNQEESGSHNRIIKVQGDAKIIMIDDPVECEVECKSANNNSGKPYKCNQHDYCDDGSTQRSIDGGRDKNKKYDTEDSLMIKDLNINRDLESGNDCTNNREDSHFEGCKRGGKMMLNYCRT